MFKNRKGFTLIELIVVIAIISILVGLATPMFLGYTADAKLKTIMSDIKNVGDINDLYYMKHNKFAIVDGVIETEGLTAINKKGETIENFSAIGFKKVDLTKATGLNFTPSRNNTGGFLYNETTEEVVYLGKVKVSKSEEKEVGAKPLDKEEIQAKIDLGWIPVANGDELNRINLEEENTFGLGTEWEGLYTSGNDFKYVQVADINLSSFSNWTPISHDTSGYFRGEFDGGNFKISNLISSQGGLFHENWGTLKNINLINVDIDVVSGDNIGGLVGMNQSYIGVGIIDNCSVTGKISSEQTTGGLAGYNNNDTLIVNSKANVVVTGTSNNIGGLVGENNGEIRNSIASGNVTGVQYVGGLVGSIDGGIIKNSTATGNVIGNKIVGGLVGGSSTNVINSHATGNVTGLVIIGEDLTGDYIGGLIGYNTGEITDSSAKGKITGNDSIGGLAGYHNNENITNSNASGEVNGVNKVGGLVGENHNNITNSNAEGNVKGIGTATGVGGLVGENQGDITNSHATGNVEGNNTVMHSGGTGGLLGQNHGSITDSTSSGSVEGNDTVGSLIGFNTGNLTNCSASGSPTGNENVGGLTGINYGEIN